MDKIKSLLHSGKKDDETVQDGTGPTRKLTGEGSHFGTGGTGTDSAGYSLGKDTEGQGYSAAEPTGNTDSSGYDIAKGPETLGTRQEGNHVNTAATLSALGEDDDGVGRAAIGQTSTYSSHPLSTGDKTSRVIDPTSTDANTFRRPEVSSSTGVPPHAAETAARRAMDPEHEHMPGGYPEESSNPYASSHIDPRVDSAGHAPVRESHTGRDAALGAGAGAAGLGGYEATRSHEPTSSSTTAPSTLTSTTNPTERSSAYGSASESRGLDSATPATTSTPATASSPATTTTEEPAQKKSMVGTVLGALGLGGGAAAAKHEHDKDSAVDSHPSTTTGVDSYRTPSQSGPPPSHHRKESIPTTAYPSGSLDSVRPNAGPTGQAPTSESHLGRNAAIGAGGLGAAGLGAHEYEKSREPITGAGTSTFASGNTSTSVAAPNTSTVHDLVTADTPQTSSTTADSSHHYGRDAAIGGGALGAAGLGAHEYEKNRESASSSGMGPTGQSQLGSSNQNREAVATGVTPQTSQNTADSSHHYGRDAAIGGGALGAAGLGAHEYEKNRESAPSSGIGPTGQSQLGSSSQDRDTVAPGVTAGVTPTSQHYGNQPIEAAQSSQTATDDSHRYGRDAAIGGGALGAAGLAAHEHEKSRDLATTGATSSSQGYAGDNTKNFSGQVDPRTDAAGNPRSGTGVAAAQAGTTAQPENKEHHYGRDTALVGGGAAAAGVAAHEYSEHDAEKAEKEHAKLQKQQTKEVAKEEKAHEKEIKKEQKAEEKAEKKHEKELAKEEKKEEKLAAKEEKKHEKEVAKEDKKEEKLAAKDEKKHHHEEEGAAAVGAGALGAGAYGAEKGHHGTATNGGGLAAADAADAEAYNKKNRYTAALADPGADPTVRKPSLATAGDTDHYGRDAAVGTAGVGALGAAGYEAEKAHGQSTTQGTHGSDPYYNRQQAPDSAIAGGQTGSTMPSSGERHLGRDAAIGGAGAGAVGAGAYGVEQGQSTTQGTHGSDPYYNRHPVPDSAIAGQQPGSTTTAAAHGTHGTDSYYNRHQVPDSAIAGQQTGSITTPSTQHHTGRDAALGGASAAAIGGTAYEADKHQSHTHSLGHKSGLAAADEDDRHAYGKEHKKPSLFKRIFKRKKNAHTGESEDDEENYEDVPHDHEHGTGTGVGGGVGGVRQHEEGELTKPSYNPFKKDDGSTGPVEGRI